MVTVAGTSHVPNGSKSRPEVERVQQSRQTNSQQAEGGSECRCLNWKEAYRSKKAFCGQGKELALLESESQLSLDLMLPFVESEYCSDFFERLDHNRCVTLQHGTSAEKQQHNTWCYVSPQCQHLNQGTWLPRGGASWKTCHAGKDSLLRDLSLPELSTLANDGELDLGLLVRFSYPVQPQLWQDVEEFWWFAELAERPQSVCTAMAARAPVVYEVLQDGAGDKVVAVGEQLWAVNYDPAKNPRTRFGHECMLGCDNVVQSHTRRTSEAPNSPSEQEVEASANAECRCLNWKDTYSSGLVNCGQGREHAPAFFTADPSWQQALPFINFDICRDFYERLDHNNCVKLAPETNENGRSDEWCYVSAECTNLSGGAPVEGLWGPAVSWKICDEESAMPSPEVRPVATTPHREAKASRTSWTIHSWKEMTVVDKSFAPSHEHGTSRNVHPWQEMAVADKSSTAGLERRTSWSVHPWKEHTVADQINTSRRIAGPSLNTSRRIAGPPQHSEVLRGNLQQGPSRGLEAIVPDQSPGLTLPMVKDMGTPSLRGALVLYDSNTPPRGAAVTMYNSSSRRWCLKVAVVVSVLIVVVVLVWWLVSLASHLPWAHIKTQRFALRWSSIARHPSKWSDAVRNSHVKDQENEKYARAPLGSRSPAAHNFVVDLSPAVQPKVTCTAHPPSAHLPGHLCPGARPPDKTSASFCMHSPAVASIAHLPKAGWEHPPDFSSPLSFSSNCRREAPAPPASPPPLPCALPVPTGPAGLPLVLPVPCRSAQTLGSSALLQRMPDIAASASSRTTFFPGPGSSSPGHPSPPASSHSSRGYSTPMSFELPVSSPPPAARHSTHLVAMPHSGYGQSALVRASHRRYTS